MDVEERVLRHFPKVAVSAGGNRPLPVVVVARKVLVQARIVLTSDILPFHLGYLNTLAIHILTTSTFLVLRPRRFLVRLQTHFLQVETLSTRLGLRILVFKQCCQLKLHMAGKHLLLLLLSFAKTLHHRVISTALQHCVRTTPNIPPRSSGEADRWPDPRLSRNRQTLPTHSYLPRSPTRTFPDSSSHVLLSIAITAAQYRIPLPPRRWHSVPRPLRSRSHLTVAALTVSRSYGRNSNLSAPGHTARTVGSENRQLRLWSGVTGSREVAGHYGAVVGNRRQRGRNTELPL